MIETRALWRNCKPAARKAVWSKKIRPEETFNIAVVVVVFNPKLSCAPETAVPRLPRWVYIFSAHHSQQSLSLVYRHFWRKPAPWRAGCQARVRWYCFDASVFPFGSKSRCCFKGLVSSHWRIGAYPSESIRQQRKGWLYHGRQPWEQVWQCAPRGRYMRQKSQRRDQTAARTGLYHSVLLGKAARLYWKNVWYGFRSIRHFL